MDPAVNADGRNPSVIHNRLPIRADAIGGMPSSAFAVWAKNRVCELSVDGGYNVLGLGNGFMYLVALDVYSRYIMSWSLSNTLDTEFCLEALKLGLAKRRRRL